ncbi:actin-related protein 6 [Marchantia polymorpha subsp. ruderalis]|uniref:Actin-related protein 6 n=2 Tax=Marchantia polymorpha TaxID=3197 RepID=A0A176VUV5_MARPO|nr:hypothetical protein AXG93_2415s1620 [Marchantia polymorpha subsp. ruderalis]PTQ35748.1 hypothetical protein MARPO_0069s0083 [Marchantia polymorpha]BBN03542.1 hypothetical protein Mp_2g24340 [Marchantia polymorpha subsp. ruderalis]|eukprot:PTQ35748.1 hypothetical protein MARPO_0069s0083 [Marchantia polymorpha]
MARGGGGGAGGAGKTTVVVLDNGAGFCKAGFGGETDPSVVVPNCMARPRSAKKWVVGDQISEVQDIQGISIRRPMDRGYLINPDTEKEIWERVFKTHLKIRPSECSLLLVEPLFNLPSIQKSTDEIVFEEFGFQSLFVANAPALSHNYQVDCAPDSLIAKSNCSLVVDAGFSFTHAVPVFDGFVVNHAARRMNLGGKALTNYLKELVSYRAWNMMDETYIMEDVKEKLCLCSLDTAADLDVARSRGRSNYFLCDYILPDGIKHKRGFVKNPQAASAYMHKRKKVEPVDMEEDDDEEIAEKEETRSATKAGLPAKEDHQILTLTNERFLVPEMLFHPADLGMNEAGLAECIVRAVKACHPTLHPVMYSNVLLTGGSTLFNGFKERLENELRPLVPDEFEVNVQSVDDPLLAAWKGGSMLAASQDFHTAAITKREYEESGSSRCRRRFMF